MLTKQSIKVFDRCIICTLTFHHSNGILKCMREVAQECELLLHTTVTIRITEVLLMYVIYNRVLKVVIMC